MQNIFQEIEAKSKEILQLLTQIAAIPSPGGCEQKKIHFLKKKIQEYGLTDVSTDGIGNSIAKLPAEIPKKKNKTILIVAHADTACDPGEKVTVRENDKYIYGHGVCDNSAGITGILTTIKLIKKFRLKFPNNLIFGFTVGEEGLGAKRGMKQIIRDYGKQLDAVINVESHPVGRVTNQAIGQYRCQISVDTKSGGHSFRDFGRPNANVILTQIISDFSRVTLPQKKGKTTFNVGQMKGEGSINAIAQNSSCLLEIRSEENRQLDKAREKLAAIIDKYKKQFPDVSIKTDILAETPAVFFPSSHKIYQLTMETQKKLGIIPKINAGNTDGDVSLAAGIPTVTIGTSIGFNTHSLNEYLEKNSLPVGVKQVFMVIYKIAAAI